MRRGGEPRGGGFAAIQSGFTVSQLRSMQWSVASATEMPQVLAAAMNSSAA